MQYFWHLGIPRYWRSAFLLLALISIASANPGSADDPSLHMELSTWGDRVGFALVGSIIVICTLILLWLLCELVGIPFKQQAAREALKTAAATPAAAPSPSQAPEAIAEEAPIPIAAIAAAVAVCVDKPHRLVDVQPHRGGEHWARVGRHQHFESHRLR